MGGGRLRRLRSADATENFVGPAERAKRTPILPNQSREQHGHQEDISAPRAEYIILASVSRVYFVIKTCETLMSHAQVPDADFVALNSVTYT